MKNTLKNTVFYLVSIIALPLIILFYALSTIFNRDKTFASFSQFLSLIPGFLGVYIRASFYRFCMKQCHRFAHIGFATLFSQQDTNIAQGVYIGPQCNIGKCTIGENTLIGSAVHIMSGKKQHAFDDINTPIKDQGGVFENVSLGSNCWLGNGALIMANIGNNCIVAAGAVVVNDIPENSIVAGNPAKILKTRVAN